MTLLTPLTRYTAIRHGATWILTVLLLGAWIFVTGCDPWRESYLKGGVEIITKEEIEKKLGPPFREKESILDGETIWTYRFAFMEKDLDPMGMDTLGKGISDVANAATAMLGKPSGGQAAAKPICLHYLLTFDKTNVLRDWKREPC
ncbi:MAG: hypothetical protein GKS05_09785 [Nitrospirales bacterium]|nr:hypothetical protein [Nitrospirales bacterium]